MNVLSAKESLIFKWLILYYVTFTSIKEKKKEGKGKKGKEEERRRGERERSKESPAADAAGGKEATSES